MKDTWETMLKASALESQFIFPGYVPYEQVPSYCAVMDICVAPYHRSTGDSSPVKIFDYLACGKPVVATDVGETSRFFTDSDAVVIVPPEDPAALAQGLISLLENEALRAEMGKKGRAFVVGRYSRIQIAEMVEAVAVRLLPTRE
jgi:glycosyltransferase involved in cell wall biosynthesis